MPAPGNILSASVQDFVLSTVHSSNKCPDVPCADGAAEMDATELYA